MSKAVYMAALGEVPVYGETQTSVNLSTSTVTSFFTHNAGSGSTKWTLSNGGTGTIKLVPGNIGIDNTTASVTLTAATALTNVRLNCSYTTETSYDKLTITAAGTTVASAVSGSGTKSWTGNMTKGQTIVLKYVKDTSQSASGEANTNVTIACNALTMTTQTIVGYEEKVLARKGKKLYTVLGGVTKKVKKGYESVNGVARLFYSSDARFISYSGTYTTSDMTVDGAACTLYTLTGSGTLVIDGDGARVWMNGGGANGGAGYDPSTLVCSGGYGGGGGFVTSGELASGEYTVTVGARQGTTLFVHKNGTTTSAAGATNQNGASGGGGRGTGSNSSSGGTAAYAGGSGQGISTYPFNITSLYAHSAGGGGGAALRTYGSDGTSSGGMASGGTGGSNGGAGGKGATSQYTGGAGGTRGGGKGGAAQSSGYNGGNATFYGSGGGGGARIHSTYSYGDEDLSTYEIGTGGAGYQGVAYILIPT